MHDMLFRRFTLLFIVSFVLRIVQAFDLEHSAAKVPYVTGQTINVRWKNVRSNDPPSFNLFLHILHSRAESSVNIRLKQDLSTNGQNPIVQIVIPNGYPGVPEGSIRTYISSCEYYLVAMSPDETETYKISENFRVGASGSQSQLFSSPPLVSSPPKSESSSDSGDSGGSSSNEGESSNQGNSKSPTGNSSNSPDSSSNNADSNESTTVSSSSQPNQTNAASTTTSTTTQSSSATGEPLAVTIQQTTTLLPIGSEGNLEGSGASGSEPTESSVAPVGASSSGLSRGVLAGIVISALVALFIFIAIIFLMLRRQKIRRRAEVQMENEAKAIPAILLPEYAPDLERPREKDPSDFEWTDAHSLDAEDRDLEGNLPTSPISRLSFGSSDLATAGSSTVISARPDSRDIRVLRLQAEVQMLREELVVGISPRTQTPPPEYYRQSHPPPPI